MKILVDIGHPAHVHYFKNLIKKLSKDGHSIVITARDKEIAHYLLETYDFDYKSRGKGSNSILGKLLYTITADYELLKLALQENPDLFLSFGAMYCSHVSFLMGKENIIIDDTENATLGQLFYRPFSNTILSPDCFRKDFGSNHLKFPSYMELSYLHPNVFVPDKTILKDLGIQNNEKFVILRFVGWKAAHDLGHRGISLKNKIRAVREFEKYAKVFISSEFELPESISRYEIDIPPERIHHALAFATMFFGESATMASESAVLGTPAIYVDDKGRGYTDEQEYEYGLVFNFSESEEDQVSAIKKGVEVLQKPRKKWLENKGKLLADKIDLTEFLIWFITNYPKSKEKFNQQIKNFN